MPRRKQPSKRQPKTAVWPKPRALPLVLTLTAREGIVLRKALAVFCADNRDANERSSLLDKLTDADRSVPDALPCPFCGGSADDYTTLRAGYENDQEDPDAFAHFVMCNSCAVRGPWKKTATGAVAAWNMRTPAQAEG